MVDASWLITSHMFRDSGSALGHVCHDQWHCLGEGFDEALAQVWNRSAGFVLVLAASMCSYASTSRTPIPCSKWWPSGRGPPLYWEGGNVLGPIGRSSCGWK
jgi:hypothetical protein